MKICIFYIFLIVTKSKILQSNQNNLTLNFENQNEIFAHFIGNQLIGDEYRQIRVKITALENEIKSEQLNSPSLTLRSATTNTENTKYMSGGVNPTPISTKTEPNEKKILELGQLRKLLQMKRLILFLQPKIRKIGDFSKYGCHCLPRGATNIDLDSNSAHGMEIPIKPLDKIDASCLAHRKCHLCAGGEFSDIDTINNSCNPSITTYSFELKYNKLDPYNVFQRDIICKDDWETTPCRRAVCECDRGLAEKLRSLASEYDEKLHHDHESFTSFEDMCLVGYEMKNQAHQGHDHGVGAKFWNSNQNGAGLTREYFSSEKDSEMNALGKNIYGKQVGYPADNGHHLFGRHKENACCGKYEGGNRQIFNTRSRLCCFQNKIYDPNIQQCCENGTITSFGMDCKP